MFPTISWIRKIEHLLFKVISIYHIIPMSYNAFLSFFPFWAFLRHITSTCPLLECLEESIKSIEIHLKPYIPYKLILEFPNVRLRLVRYIKDQTGCNPAWTQTPRSNSFGNLRVIVGWSIIQRYPTHIFLCPIGASKRTHGKLRLSVKLIN